MAPVDPRFSIVDTLQRGHAQDTMLCSWLRKQWQVLFLTIALGHVSFMLCQVFFITKIMEK